MPSHSNPARPDEFSQHFIDAAAAKRSFYVDALSITVPLRIDLNIQLTLIASTFYQVLAQRLDPRYQTAKSRTIFDKFVNAPATIITQYDQIVVRLTRCAHNTELRTAGYVGSQGPSPGYMIETSSFEIAGGG